MPACRVHHLNLDWVFWGRKKEWKKSVLSRNFVRRTGWLPKISRKFEPTNVTECWYFGVSFWVRKFGALCFWKSWKEDVFVWSKKCERHWHGDTSIDGFLGTIKFPQWLLLQDKSESIRVDDWNYYPTHPPETGAYDLVAYVTWYAKHERN